MRITTNREESIAYTSVYCETTTHRSVLSKISMQYIEKTTHCGIVTEHLNMVAYYSADNPIIISKKS